MTKRRRFFWQRRLTLSEEACFDFRCQSGKNSDQRSVLWQDMKVTLLQCSTFCFSSNCDSDEAYRLTSVSFDSDDLDTVQESRKISYYGTVHRTLLQQSSPIVGEREKLPSSCPSLNTPSRQEKRRRSRVFSLSL